MTDEELDAIKELAYRVEDMPLVAGNRLLALVAEVRRKNQALDFCKAVGAQRWEMLEEALAEVRRLRKLTYDPDD